MTKKKSEIKFINTNIVFAPHSKTGRMCGFISKVGNRWRGVRETDESPKIIVLVDTELTKRIEQNVLYKCRLVPMIGRLGYVAVTASPLQYKARVEVEMTGRTYKVYVKFGNKSITFDPNSRDPRFNNYNNVVSSLESFKCIKNLGETIEELRNSINITSAHYV